MIDYEDGGRLTSKRGIMTSVGIEKARVLATALAGLLLAFTYQVSALPRSQDAKQGTTVWDGVYNKDQAARGQAKYMAVCSNCHQGDLSGSDQAPGLAGGDFLDRWEGQTVGDLADRIRTSMPLDDVGSLNVQLSADITAFLLQANNFPAGTEELKADRSFMKAVAIKRK
jgi:mono/diheme cytochrome c family protein